MHRTRQSFKFFLRVPMFMFVIRYKVVMIMRMRNCMRMGRSIMRVFKYMLMLVCMMPDQSVSYYKNRTCNHDE